LESSNNEEKCNKRTCKCSVVKFHKNTNKLRSNIKTPYSPCKRNKSTLISVARRVVRKW
jgi:hypothetical protein